MQGRSGLERHSLNKGERGSAMHIERGQYGYGYSPTTGQLTQITAPMDKMSPMLEDKAELAEIPRAQRLAHRPSLKALFTKSVRENKASRDKAICDAHSKYGYTMAAIAREVGLHYSTVSKVIKGDR